MKDKQQSNKIKYTTDNGGGNKPPLIQYLRPKNERDPYHKHIQIPYVKFIHNKDSNSSDIYAFMLKIGDNEVIKAIHKKQELWAEFYKQCDNNGDMMIECITNDYHYIYILYDNGVMVMQCAVAKRYVRTVCPNNLGKRQIDSKLELEIRHYLYNQAAIHNLIKCDVDTQFELFLQKRYDAYNNVANNDNDEAELSAKTPTKL